METQPIENPKIGPWHGWVADKPKQTTNGGCFLDWIDLYAIWVIQELKWDIE